MPGEFNPEEAGVAATHGFDPESAGTDTTKSGLMDALGKAQTTTDLSPMQRVGAAMLGPFGFPSAVTGKAPSGLGTDLLLEAGIPAGAQALTAELSPAVQAGVGFLSSGIGNILAQGRRIIAGEQPEGFSLGQLGAASGTGAIPFVGPAKNAARLTRSGVLSLIKESGIEAAKMGAVAVTGETIKTLVDEQRFPTLGEDGVAAIIPTAIGSALPFVRSAASGLRTAGRRVAENAADYSAVGVQPTPGMLAPEQLAGAEQRLAKASPGGEVAQSVDAVKGALSEGMQNVAPNPQEGAAIFKQVSPMIGQLSNAESEVAKLSDQAKAAQQEAHDALAELGRRRSIRQATETEVASKADQKLTEEITDQADKASKNAFNEAVKSANEIAGDLALNRATIGSQMLDSATGRDLFVEGIVKPVMAAKDNYFAQQYSLFDNQAKVFNAAPILAFAEDTAATSMTGNLPRRANAAITQIRNNLSGEKVSLQDLRNTRSEILRNLRMGDFESDADERLAKQMSSEITKQINDQAVNAFGEELGPKLKATNSQYREFSDAMDARGVDLIFSKKPSDAYVRTVLSDMEKNGGINADSYKNIQKVIDQAGTVKFNSPDVGPSMQQGSELAKELRAHVQGILKSSILYDSAQNIDGKLVVSGPELVKNLDKVTKTPGTAEALGFGSDRVVGELRTLFKDYPAASKIAKDDLEELFDSPAFKAATLPPAYGGVGAIVPRETLMKQFMEKFRAERADSQAQNLLLKSANLKAAGAEDAARQTYQRAVDTVKSVNGDLAAVRDHYEDLLQDPVAIAFNNPNLPDRGFNAFAKALFDPAANALENKEVAQIVNSLRTSPNPQNQATLLRLQERYIADKISAYQSTNKSSLQLNAPDTEAVASFFSPANPGDAANEIERARTLLDPTQFHQLTEFSKTAKALAKYEKLGDVTERNSKYTIPVYGMVRRGFDAVADLVRDGQYKVAAKLLSNPDSFIKSSIRVGDAADAAIPVAQRAAIGTGRTIDNRRR